MSTVRDPKALGLPRKDPFRYGWRYVRRVLPDGSETFDQVKARQAAEVRAKNAEARAKKHAQPLNALEAQNRELQERLRRLEGRQQEQSDSEEQGP